MEAWRHLGALKVSEQERDRGSTHCSCVAQLRQEPNPFTLRIGNKQHESKRGEVMRENKDIKIIKLHTCDSGY